MSIIGHTLLCNVDIIYMLHSLMKKTEFKITAFLDVIPCNFMNWYQHFGKHTASIVRVGNCAEFYRTTDSFLCPSLFLPHHNLSFMFNFIIINLCYQTFFPHCSTLFQLTSPLCKCLCWDFICYTFPSTDNSFGG
jgi:hypothetical protein